MKQFELSKPFLNHDEIKLVSKSIKSGWISTSGKDVKKFEQAINKKFNSKFAVAINSGTSAIHLSLRTIGVASGDEVLVSSLTFVATINPILYLGAKPVFFDVNEKFEVNIKDIILFIKKNTVFKNGFSYNKTTKKKVKAVVIVHLWGNACNFEELIYLCKKKNIKIIEDAAEAVGTKLKIRNKYFFCGTIGDIGCYSFNGNKIISTGSGGAIITKNKKFYEYANYLANQAKDDTFSYIHNDIGYNYKLNNILSVIGISQLKKLNSIIKKKRKIYSLYSKEFGKFKKIKLLKPSNETLSNHWLNILTFEKINKKFIQNLRNFLANKKIEIRQVWRPNHMQKKYKKFQKYNILLSEKIYNKSICVPSSINLKDKDIIFISSQIKKFYENSSFNK